MKKEIFQQPTSRAELFQQVEEQSKRINFLNNILKAIKEDSIMNNSVEIEFIDNGFTDLFEKIQKSSKETISLIITDQLKKEEEIFQKLLDAIKDGDAK